MSDQDAELRMVELTERQAEIADWYMGSPGAEEWFDENIDTDTDFSHLPRPKLKGRKFALPNDPDVLDDFIYRVTEQFVQMGMDAAEIDTTQKMLGVERAANNLADKVRDALDDEIVEETEKMKRNRAKAIREGGFQ